MIAVQKMEPLLGKLFIKVKLKKVSNWLESKQFGYLRGNFQNLVQLCTQIAVHHLWFEANLKNFKHRNQGVE